VLFEVNFNYIFGDKKQNYSQKRWKTACNSCSIFNKHYIFMETFPKTTPSTKSNHQLAEKIIKIT